MSHRTQIKQSPGSLTSCNVVIVRRVRLSLAVAKLIQRGARADIGVAVSRYKPLTESFEGSSRIPQDNSIKILSSLEQGT